MKTFKQYLTEVHNQHEIHYGTNLENLKRIAKDSKGNEARFLYRNHTFIGCDACHHNHAALVERVYDSGKATSLGFIDYLPEKKIWTHYMSNYDSEGNESNNPELLKKFEKHGIPKHNVKIHGDMPWNSEVRG